MERGAVKIAVIWGLCLSLLWGIDARPELTDNGLNVNNVTIFNPASSLEDDQCKRKTNKTCQPLEFPTCFGVSLPYEFTSNELVNENYAQYQIKDELKRWEGLRNSPKCWNVIRPLLCFLYKPKCHDNRVELPPQKLCQTVKKHCGVIKKALKEWPDILRCEDSSKYSSRCHNNDLRDLRFNFSDTSSNYGATCMAPLMPVTSKFNYYEGFEGCAFNCSDPLFSKEEHEKVSSVVKWLGLVSGGANLFVLITALLDWKSAKQYPTVILFYVNFWYALATLGWMFQFLSSTKDDIVCRKDATIRRNEPDSGENVFCSMVFFFIYFGVMSSLAWLCVLAYVWNLLCNAVGRVRERLIKKRPIFNFFAFLCPLFLTMTCISTGNVDASSISGVCFVGVNDNTAKILFLLTPLGSAFLFMMTFFWRGINRLRSVSFSSSEFISDKSRRQIQGHAVRVGILSMAMLIVVVISFVFQFRLMTAKPLWEKSFQDDLICKMNLVGTDAECELEEKADVSMVVADLVMFFVGGLLVSSWAWTGATVHIWVKFIRRLCHCDPEEQEERGKGKGQKGKNLQHKGNAPGISARHQQNPVLGSGRLSISFKSTHGDLMGMNKLLESALMPKPDLEQSQQLNHTGTDMDTDTNSEWAAGIPHLMSARGASIGNSVSCVSEGTSRWPSVESDMSEMATRERRSYRNMFSRRPGNKSGIGKQRSRRGFGGSSFSVGSSTGSRILPAIMALIKKNVTSTGNNPVVDTHSGVGAVLNENAMPLQPRPPRTLLVKEIGIQTSFEKLYTPKHTRKGCEIGIQSSLISLHEIGTQTKKSATKKSKKKEKGVGGGCLTKQDGHEDHYEDDQNSGKEEEEEEPDPITQLLTPI